jgi:hypothetical protein
LNTILNGRSILVSSIRHNSINIFIHLMTNQQITEKDLYYITKISISNANIIILNWLIKNTKIDINKIMYNEGISLLHHACFFESKKIISLLVEAGVDLSIKTQNEMAETGFTIFEEMEFERNRISRNINL